MVNIPRIGKVTYEQMPAVAAGRLVSAEDRAQFSEIFAKKDVSEYHFILCAKKDGQLVAAARVYSAPSFRNIHLEFIETAANAHGRGYGQELMEHLFQQAALQQKTLSSDGFTGEGRSHLMRVVERHIAEDGPDCFSVINRV